jgi:hypothetical protein
MILEIPFTELRNAPADFASTGRFCPNGLLKPGSFFETAQPTGHAVRLQE